MRLLLDTHILLWWLDDNPALSPRARDLIAEPANVVVVSAASVWEIRIKEGLGKLKLSPTFQQVLEQQPFERLAVTIEHAHRLRSLPPHHRDPFDRMLIAQAQYEALTLLTADDVVRRYDVVCEIV